ncbi:MAG: hypothetical protein R3F39_16220 [Myxococcota bacterium]
MRAAPFAATAIALAVGLLGAAADARAADEACAAVESVDAPRYLRQLTLDLWGRVPSVAELEALGDADVTEAHVDAMLADEQFYALVRRHHADLLYPNLDQFELAPVAFSLLLPALYYEYDEVSDPTRLFVLYVGLYFRGALVPCADEPATFDANGEVVLKPWPDGTMRDGWVMVEPYWAPGTQVKVCALEARAVAKASNGEPCTSYTGVLTGSCGCGEGLRYCLSIESGDAIRQSLRTQMERAIERPMRAGAPYFDFLTERTEELDGPLTHYYKYIAQIAVDPIIFTPPVAPATIEPRPFVDATWKSYARPAFNSGILTSLQFLLRFQTSRARANRYWDAFLCAPFQAPDLELPSPNDPCSLNPNLRERCGCNSCHVVLEPATAYWARFADAGSLRLDSVIFPDYSAVCDGCDSKPGGCNFICDRFYLTRAGHPDEEPYVGTLRSLMWRDAAELAQVAAGPSALVAEGLEGGALGRCASQKMFERLHGRLVSTEADDALVGAVADAFEASNYDFRALVKAWVMSPSYRRMVR